MLTAATEKTVVLLGAGASVEAGLPTSNELSKRVLAESFFPEEKEDPFRDIYRIIAGSIIFGVSKHGRDPMAYPVNVEDIAEGLRLLDRHDYSTFRELLGGVPTAISRLEEKFLNSKRPETLAELIFDSLNAETPKDKQHVAETLAKTLAEQNFSFPSYYQQALDSLQKFCFSELSKRHKPATYLEPLIRSTRIMCIATLNYDLLLEETCAGLHRSYDLGVFKWKKGHLRFKKSALPIIKLHGSIDWYMERDWDLEDDGRWMGPQCVKRGQGAYGVFAKQTPCSIFGRNNKLRAGGPFLDLLTAFESQLEKCHQLYVIGYSFGDDHINTVLQDWLSLNRRNEMSVASGPGFFKYYEDGDLFYQEWNPNQVAVSKMKAGEAIAKWFPEN